MRYRIAAILLLLLALVACDPAQSTFRAYGPAAEKLSQLSWFMTILFLVVSVIMWVLIAWAAKRKRGTLAEHAPIDVGGGQGWIAIGGLAVPLAVLTLIFVLGLNLLAEFQFTGHITTRRSRRF
jgi:uncharacterized membrane protein (DUF485 family)